MHIDDIVDEIWGGISKRFSVGGLDPCSMAVASTCKDVIRDALE